MNNSRQLVSAFLEAAKNGDVEEILRLIIEEKVHVNVTGVFGCRTALHEACDKGAVDVVRTLIEHGAVVEGRDSSGRTPLQLAAWRSHLEVVQVLLSRGALVNVHDNHGYTALYASTSPGVVRCLLSHGAAVSVGDAYGRTALHYLANVGLEEALQVMDLHVAHGADVGASNPDGLTPLHIAANCGRADIVERLLRVHGANVSALTVHNYSPLDVALNHDEGAAAKSLQAFIDDMSQEWRPHRHCLYPLTFRSAVATVVDLWSWNPATAAPWHPDSPFPILSLEVLFEVFIWLAADILAQGYVVIQKDPRMP